MKKQFSDENQNIEVLNTDEIKEKSIEIKEFAKKDTIKEENYSSEIAIKKQKAFAEGNLPLEINIIKTEEQKGGFFGLGRSHIVYVIRTTPGQWEVKRRFRDFTWLRDILAKLYPGFLVF